MGRQEGGVWRQQVNSARTGGSEGYLAVWAGKRQLRGAVSGFGARPGGNKCRLMEGCCSVLIIY